MKFDEKTVQKSIQNRGAEKYRKIMPTRRKKDRKWSRKGSPKSTKSRYNSRPEKVRNFLKKPVPALATLRRTNRAGNSIRATQPTSQPTNQPPNRPTNQPANQPTNQPTDFLHGRSNSFTSSVLPHLSDLLKRCRN